ncbi:4-hydroxy-tetrahydrodipicolinate synthase [Sulfobacillus thermosulfidooxidans]|uniref:4-hydroxy-tetrahydrodipicolinate synthase n=1 Tax=Sulfobacillus thermosulfidooxidans TaxID=28034 RepID=UPI0006B4FDF4|nr:4-hydroxy-tetrahydrodipicolinate synthase [Sulfobacillus thermosulfidooxidans]
MIWPRIFTAMVTPFTDEGEIDTEAAAGLARYLRDNGSGGLILAGSTGEAFSLTAAERKTLYNAVREAVHFDIPVWIGTGTNDTRTTIELSVEAASWGADGILLVSPYYNKPTPDGLLAHYINVSQHVSCPMMLYNVPGRTASMVDANTIIAISQQVAVPFAVKEASGSLDQIMRLRTGLSPDVPIYSGDDGLYFPSLAVGIHGVVSVASHVVGKEMREMTERFLRGDIQGAQSLHDQLWPLFKALFVVSNPLPLKWLLSQLHFIRPVVRSPLIMPDDSIFAPVWSAYTQAKHLSSLSSRKTAQA